MTSPRTADLLPAVVDIAVAAGEGLAATFSTGNRVQGRDELIAAVRRNEDASAPGLRDALAALRPTAVWLEDENQTRALPPGEFWAVDAVEGNVNHVHGLGDWCVSITLVRDGDPVLAVVRQPVGDRTYTALKGGGATLNGVPLAVSAKSDLRVAIAATGQAEAGQAETYGRLGRSITAMLKVALLVRASVPSTFPLLLLASGQHDLFWQYEPTLPGVAAGILLVTEAGGVVSRLDGTPWAPGSSDVLVATPALHRAAVDVLATAA